MVVRRAGLVVAAVRRTPLRTLSTSSVGTGVSGRRAVAGRAGSSGVAGIPGRTVEGDLLLVKVIGGRLVGPAVVIVGTRADRRGLMMGRVRSRSDSRIGNRCR